VWRDAQRPFPKKVEAQFGPSEHSVTDCAAAPRASISSRIGVAQRENKRRNELWLPGGCALDVAQADPSAAGGVL
jgi:hypothetical protein